MRKNYVCIINIKSSPYICLSYMIRNGITYNLCGVQILII